MALRETTCRYYEDPKTFTLFSLTLTGGSGGSSSVDLENFFKKPPKPPVTFVDETLEKAHSFFFASLSGPINSLSVFCTKYGTCLMSVIEHSATSACHVVGIMVRGSVPAGPRAFLPLNSTGGMMWHPLWKQNIHAVPKITGGSHGCPHLRVTSETKNYDIQVTTKPCSLPQEALKKQIRPKLQWKLLSAMILSSLRNTVFPNR